MKKFSLFIVAFFSFFAVQIFAQEVHFLSPLNGQVYVCSSNNTAAVFVNWNTSNKKSAHYYYVKLFTDVRDFNSKTSNEFDPWFYPGEGTHSWRIELWEGDILGSESKVYEETVTFYAKYKLYAANNFGAGSINLEGASVQSGSNTLKLVGESVVVGAIDQNSGGYDRTWNTSGTNNSQWEIKNAPIPGATSRNYTYSVTSNDNLATLVADMKKICNITFGGNSSVYVNGTLYSSPKTTQVIELNPVTASAESYSSNNVNFTFENWKKDGVTYSTTFTPADHGSYNAVYRAKPSNSGEYVTFSNNYNQPIVIYWTDNANPNVTQYRIYRKVKHNGVVGPETLIGTVGSGVQSFTDQDYFATSTYSDDLLWYDVRAYYNSTDPYIIGDYSDAAYYAVYGKESLIKMNESASTSELPTEYSVGNYPNPFNPTTTIKYQLPEAGMVTLKVYDILGREVAALVNENKSAGYYEVNFDASKLTSGVYIYTIQAGKYTESKKMILAK